MIPIPAMNETSDYESWLWSQGFAQRTITARTGFAAQRLREWPNLDVTPAVAGQWLAQYEGWTRWTYHSHLRSLFAWAVERGRVDVDPTASIKRPPAPRPRPNPLDEGEVERVLDAATGNLRLWLLLGLLAGLRSHEIAKLRGEEVNEQSIRLVGKGGQLAMVPMHPVLWSELRTRPRTGWVFPSPMREGRPITTHNVEQRVTTLFRSLGISGGIHRTRATYGTSLLRNGENIRVVQELMRHRSLASTEHYLAAADDELANAIRGLAA